MGLAGVIKKDVIDALVLHNVNSVHCNDFLSTHLLDGISHVWTKLGQF